MRLIAALLVFAGTTSFARDLPNLDAFTSSTVTRPLPDAASTFDGVVTGTEPRLGVPTFFWAAPPAPGTRSPRDLGLNIEQAARRYLFAHAGLYRADAAELAEAALVHLHDTGEGVIIASFEKRVNGVSVFRDRLNVALNPRLELVALSGYLSPASMKQSRFKLAAPTALASAWFDLLGSPVESTRFHEGSLDEAGFRRFTATTELPFQGRAKNVLYALPERLVPAWHLELDVFAPGTTESAMYAFVVSAEDGSILSRKNLTEADSFGYRVWAQNSGLYLPDDGPQGITASPHPTGTNNGFVPPFIAPTLVTLQNSPLSTNDPWLATGATQTTGNNVDAYADLVAPDGFNSGDMRATTTSPNTFDRLYDTSQDPDVSSDQQRAGITQLFFDINQLHDWFYDRGFNEAAGNGQTNNFSRGGAGGDSLKAEAQDHAGSNNANMSTPADGSRPRMQMYVWVPAGLSSLVAVPGGTYPTGLAAFGAPVFTLTAGGAVVATDGCAALSGLTGKIAVIDRGTCTFATKALNAQNAGAVGVIIVNNVVANTPPGLAADGTITTVTLPVLSVTQADGTTLETNLAAGAVTLTMSRTAITRRAGALDNTVVGHEWGHYLSNRLISNAAGLGNQQGRSLGEGWADFVSLLLMVREADLQVNANWAGVYATAAYSQMGPGFANASYFGIRRYPYSTDLTRNPLTFKHIENGVALPSGPPSANGGATNAEVHNSGELWAVTLWECYAALLRASPRLTFDQARDRMMRYLVAGLKLTPPQPTFTEARDGILAAVAAADLTDFQLFSTAFARRGLGLRAVAPDRASTTHVPVVEDFSTGNELTFLGADLSDETSWCDRDGVLDVGERGLLQVMLRNVGYAPLTATTGTLTTTTPGVTILNPTLTFPTSRPYGTTLATTTLTLAGISAPTVIELSLAFNDPSLMAPAGRTATMRFRVHSDEAAASSATDDAETGITAWTFAKDAALSANFDWAHKRLSAAQGVWFGRDPAANADISLVSPPLQVAASGSLGLVLNHRWDFEADATINYDGAVIELSTNNGSTWTDVGASYTGTLGGPSSNNPLLGRQAYTGKSPGYPAFTTTTLDLGGAYGSQTVKVRFRIGSDQASAGAGWDLDSVGFTGITNTPFPRLIADRGVCVNRRPLANAGADFTADERTQVTLFASASTDPDNDPLTARWTQLTGPTVTLVNGVFTAPEVTADATLSFELIVNDGALDSAADTVVVTVRQVNRAPTANAGSDQTVEERTPVTLTGVGSDPDADAITFAWSQLSGPAVTLSDASAESPQFTAPEVSADEVVRLELVVSDGSLTASSQVRLTVRQVNQGPAVIVTAPATAPERTTVSMSATASDLDSDPLTYQWRQTGGATVTLLTPTAPTASFLAPEVTSATPLTFEVVVSDGNLNATGLASVSITDFNRAPVVVLAFESRDVKPGELINLDASGSSDPDGDALTFAWAQTGGDAAALQSAQTAVASFTMPKTGELSFAVTVSDTAGASSRGTLTFRALGGPTGCGCSSSSGLFAGALPLLMLLALRRRR